MEYFNSIVAGANTIVEMVQAQMHHNTHLANDSGVALYVEVLGPDSAKADQVVNHGDVINFGTAKGQVTVTVYFSNNRQSYAARRELPSDYSVLVRKVDGKLKIFRVKYGSLWEVDSANP